MAKLAFSKWPFNNGERVVLHWLRSPFMFGENKQWYLTASFKRRDNSFIELDLPWGALPLLKIGREYVDGYDTANNDLGKSFSIDLSAKASITIEKAVNTIPRSIHFLHNKENFNEHCAVIRNGSMTIVVPCLEVVRSFFVINKMLAQAILRPDSFNNICGVEYDEKEGSVEISFADKIPCKLLTKSLAKRMALILCDKDWNSSWAQVYHRMNLPENIDSNLSKLVCCPPIYSSCSWHVRALQKGSIIVVLELVGITPEKPFPFKDIKFRHPLSGSGRAGRAGSQFSKKEREPKSRHAGILGINQAGMAARNILSPRTNKIIVSFLKYSDEPNITETASAGSVSLLQPDSDYVITKTAKYNSRRLICDQVSLDDEGGPGVIESAEFLPIEDSNSVPKSFENFINAIKLIINSVADIEARYMIRTIPEGSALYRINGRKHRQYALVFLTYLSRTAFILEIDASDNHEISTIIFKIVSGDFREIVKKMLVEYISGTGCWDRDRLDSDNAIEYSLSRHRTVEIVSQAKRYVRHL